MNSLDNELVTQLRLLLDRDAIRDLVNRYCQGVWQKDIRVVDLYSGDGEFGEAVGREQLIARYQEIFGNGSNPHPYAHNHVIEFDGADHARGTVHNDFRATNAEGRSMIGALEWNNEYVRVDGQWRFKRHGSTVHFMVPITQGWAEASMTEPA